MAGGGRADKARGEVIGVLILLEGSGAHGSHPQHSRTVITGC